MVRMIITKIIAEVKIMTIKTTTLDSEEAEVVIEVAVEVEVDTSTAAAVVDTKTVAVEVVGFMNHVETEETLEAKDNVVVDSEVVKELISVKAELSIILKSKKLITMRLLKFISNQTSLNLQKNGNQKVLSLQLQSPKIVQPQLKTVQVKSNKKKNQDIKIKTKTTMIKLIKMPSHQGLK